ncbi:11105_t:CDS:2 [Paraglomus occultum]|uniref:11105_t:CDS:1 n=1 Tax=Paraglomus occultum TaxID=144539 RepID=A0A9N9FAZ6_9GLOM|nr:11105_t:CDS:2 [Paraglomus occultum]
MSKYSVQSTNVIPSAAWPCPLRSAFSFATIPDALEADLQEMDREDANWKKTQTKFKRARAAFDNTIKTIKKAVPSG